MLHRIKFFISCLFLCALSTGNAWGNGKVVIVPGLTEPEIKSVESYEPFFKGLEHVLSEHNVVWEFRYVGLDSAPDDAARRTLGKEAADKIKAMNPAVMVAVNDNTVKFVATQMDTIPVVAGFFFGAPESLGLPTKHITGVARRSYAVDVWSIAKQVTGANTVSLLSKNGFSMAQTRTGLLSKVDALEKMSGVRMKEMYLCDTFEEWKKHVENWTEDLIYLADTSRIIKGGVEMPSAELVRWTVDNAKVPVVGANDEVARDGALFAMVSSEELWGKQVGDMVVKILNGTAVSNIPMESVMKGKLVINAKTAMQKNIDIPYEILGSADKVYE